MITDVYAGVELDLGHTVWLFDTNHAAPVFHAAEGRPAWLGPRDGGTILVTRCGRATDHDYRRGYADALHLPPKHAVKFGRPCAVCWPQLRGRPALFTRRPAPGTAKQEALHGAR